MNVYDLTTGVEMLPLATRTSSVMGPDILVTGYTGKTMGILTSMKASAGTSPTLDVKFQTSNPVTVSSDIVYSEEGETDTKLRQGSNDNVELAAEFTTQVNPSQLKYLYLKLKRIGTIAALKTVTAAIYADTAGDPSGSAIGTSDAVSATNMSTSYDWVKFTFASPVDLEAGTTYNIVLTGNYDVSSSNCVEWRSKTVTSDGNQKIKDLTWAGTETESFEFYSEVYDFRDLLQGPEPISASTSLAFTSTGTNNIPLRNGSSDNIYLAAKFTQTATAQLKYVDLMIRRYGTIADGENILVTIYSDSSGPSAVLGSSLPVRATDLSTTYGLVRFFFVEPIDVIASTSYHVVLWGAYSVSASNQVQWRAKTVTSGGNCWISDVSWANVSTLDFEIQGYETEKTRQAYTQVTDAADSIQRLGLPCTESKQYVRAVATIGGTDTPTFTFGVYLVAAPR